ncbi:MAG: T9SS type A sorting domain-containing protein [Vicingaceae bacterium]
MNYKISLSTILIAATTVSFAQNKTGHTKEHQIKNSYYYANGVKMSEKTNTPLLFTNLHDNVIGNTPTEKALYWLTNNKALLGIEKISDLEVAFKRSSLSGHNVRFQQKLNGVPVYKSLVNVHISPSNMVTYVDNNFDPTVENINTTPALSKSQAYQIANNNIKASGKISFTSNDLSVYNTTEGTQLIYKIVIEAETPIGSWEVLVNANNGNVIHAEDKSFYYQHTDNEHKKTPVNGIGNVFLSDPLSAAGVSYGGNYTDNNDAANAQLDAAMASVTLLDIDETAGVFTLKGPYAEIVDHESPFNGLYTQNTSTFNYNRNDDEFEAVNCYYHIDNSMRYINVTLGIPLTPYQYSGGVRYDPHGLGGADNSHYSGGSGNLAFGEGCVDDAEDADVVIHELGHGLHDWLTGGSSSPSEGLGEGSGDYWAQSYSRALNQWTSADAEYQWMFNWDGHNACWNGRITNYSNVYPGGLGGGIHASGQIWATTLMRVYDQIGRTKTDKAFLEGLAMTGSFSNQQDAAIAVRQAAIDMNYSCADIDVFTNEFTTTGYTLPPYICTVGIDELEIDNIQLYPNPTQNNVTLILPNFKVVNNVRVMDNLGRTVFNTKPTNTNTQINIENVASGFYTMLIQTDNTIISKKIIKK